MSTFAVGEIAIFWYPGVKEHLCEVTILRDLHRAQLANHVTGEWRTCDVYYVQYHGLNELGPVPPEHLRKRRPPQDWHQLANLDEVPADCVSEREVPA